MDEGLRKNDLKKTKDVWSMTHKSEEVKVSIIIPVYDVSAYIERCIKSVMRQTYDNIECIIVDDATPDDCIVKCEQLIESYQGKIRFSIIHHQVNRGLSAARNTGTEVAHGEYIFYLDGDDELLPDCVEKLIKPVLKDGSIEMVIGNSKRIIDKFPLNSNPQRKIVYREEDVLSTKNVRAYYYNKGVINVNAWNKLILRSFIVDNKLSFKEGIIIEDVLWTFYVLKYINHLYLIPDVTYLHYIRPNSIMTGTSKEELARNYSIVFEEIAHHFSNGTEGEVELKYYMRQLCANYVQRPENEAIRQSVIIYKQILSERRYLLRRVALSLLLYLSEQSWGSRFFAMAISTRRFLRKVRCSVALL